MNTAKEKGPLGGEPISRTNAPSTYPSEPDSASVIDDDPEAPATQASVIEITRLHAEIVQAARMSFEKAIRLGDLLNGIKAGLRHGEWLPWVAHHLPFTDRTARNYIRIYDNREHLKSEKVSDLSEAYRLLTSHNEPDLKSGNSDGEHDFEEARLTKYARLAELKLELESPELTLRRCAEIMRETQKLQNVWERATLNAERKLGQALNQIEQSVSAAPWPELVKIYPDLVRRRKREPEVAALWRKSPGVMTILAGAHQFHIRPKTTLEAAA